MNNNKRIVMSQNQREATYNAIVTVLSNSNVTFQSGSDVKSVLTSEHKKKVKEILMTGFKNGTIASTPDFISTKMSSDSELSKYCSGLISNWIKKDSRLNGNTKYQVVNKGLRAGSGDSQVKELRKLLKATSGTDAEQEVTEALNARLAQIKATKSPTSQIDIDSLPENLRHLVK
jgi:hypothetical protein